ncbi:hypothetical protein EVAR_47442_1 [Eumeta japonica]|uniref:Uncharacterized protein n=1 Tax=Eumeta variegata TaxID=151549 RepID=A0A4C1XE54_EUMVA|nr:hypothetical protein EVAR_47442_1 [Eumeta japonica]
MGRRVPQQDNRHIWHRSPSRENNQVTFRGGELQSKKAKINCKACKDTDSTEAALKTEVSEKYREGPSTPFVRL